MFPCICVRIFVPRCHILLLYALSRRLWPLLWSVGTSGGNPMPLCALLDVGHFLLFLKGRTGQIAEHSWSIGILDSIPQWFFLILFGILFFLRLELFLSLLRERRRLRPNDWNSGAERQLNNTKKKGGNWRRRDWHTVAKNKRRACPPHFLFSVFRKRVPSSHEKKKNYFERAAPKH